MQVRELESLSRELWKISPRQIGMHVDRRGVMRQLCGGAGPHGYRRFGLPRAVVEICDHMFGGMPWDEARAIVLSLPGAIGREGRDLRPVTWRLLAEEIARLQWTHLDRTPGTSYVARLATEAGAGLRAMAAGRPWAGLVDYFERQHPPGPPPNAEDDRGQRLRADHAALTAVRCATQAALEADTVIAAHARRKTVAARYLSDLDAICRHGEERHGDLVRQTLRHCAETDGALARIAGEDGDAARVDAYRRQGEALLRLIAGC